MSGYIPQPYNEQTAYYDVVGSWSESQTFNDNILLAEGSILVLHNGSSIHAGGVGIDLECSVGYKLRWEAGVLYDLQPSEGGDSVRQSLLRNSSPSSSDNANSGHWSGAYWTTRRGEVYQLDNNTTEDDAFWENVGPLLRSTNGTRGNFQFQNEGNSGYFFFNTNHEDGRNSYLETEPGYFEFGIYDGTTSRYLGINSGGYYVNDQENFRAAINAVDLGGSYADPAWITALAASKITGTFMKSQQHAQTAYLDAANTFTQTQTIPSISTALGPVLTFGNQYCSLPLGRALVATEGAAVNYQIGKLSTVGGLALGNLDTPEALVRYQVDHVRITNGTNTGWMALQAGAATFNGNLGIGVSPSHQLHQRNTAEPFGTVGLFESVVFGGFSEWTFRHEVVEESNAALAGYSSSISLGVDGLNSYVRSSSDTIQFRRANWNPANIEAAGATFNGNLGIGVSPSYQFHQRNTALPNGTIGLFESVTAGGFSEWLFRHEVVGGSTSSLAIGVDGTNSWIRSGGDTIGFRQSNFNPANITAAGATFNGAVSVSSLAVTSNSSHIGFSDGHNYLSNMTYFRGSGLSTATIDGANGVVNVQTVGFTGGMKLVQGTATRTGFLEWNKNGSRQGYIGFDAGNDISFTNEQSGIFAFNRGLYVDGSASTFTQSIHSNDNITASGFLRSSSRIVSDAPNGFSSLETLHPTGKSFRWCLANDDSLRLQQSSDRFTATASDVIQLYPNNFAINSNTVVGSLASARATLDVRPQNNTDIVIGASNGLGGFRVQLDANTANLEAVDPTLTGSFRDIRIGGRNAYINGDSAIRMFTSGTPAITVSSVITLERELQTINGIRLTGSGVDSSVGIKDRDAATQSAVYSSGGAFRIFRSSVNQDVAYFGDTDAWVRQNITVPGNLAVSGAANFGVITSAFQSLSANPSTLDLSAGQTRIVKNTTLNEVRLWANNAGTMMSVLLT